MHYHWQILVKANSEETAKEQAVKVLNQIDTDNQAGVWDWYEIGGRWNETRNIVNAKSKLFWSRINDALHNQAKTLERYQDSLKEYLEKEESTLSDIVFKPKAEAGKFENNMSLHILGKIATIKSSYYCSDSYFATEGGIWGSPELPEKVRELIKSSPEKYWLVSVDIHN